MTVSTSHYVSVNLGTVANDGTGDDLRTAFNKVNQNFANYEAVGIPTQNISASGTIEAAYFVGDGSQLTAIPTTGLYSNANVASYLPTYSGNVANVTVTGNITITNPLSSLVVSGNVYFGGAKIESGYQYYAPTGNLAITANVNVSRIILDPTTPTVSLYANITLPASNVDATIVSISSTQTIQFLSVCPNTGTTMVNFGNLTLGAGNCFTYFYHASETRWYKIS